MRSTRCILPLATLLALPAAATAGGIGDYLGKWEMAIANSGTSFRSCALKVTEKEGAIDGEMVWRWGSVFKIGGQAALGKGGELEIRYDDWSGPLTLRRVGDALEGSVKMKDGKTVDVIASRGEEETSVIGTWDMSVKTDEGTKTGTLKFARAPGGDLQAEAINPEGKKVEVRDLTLEGGKVHFRFVLGDRQPEFTGEARGDRLVGKVVAPGEAREIPAEGVRKRTWGTPVKLLPENGLAGWRPRDASRPFGWTCKEGVLTNSEAGDVDIVSERKFQDFQLHVEFKMVRHGNSGVYLRGRYEVQIQDDYGQPLEAHGIGAIYSRAAPLKNAAKPAEEWQNYDISITGRWATVKLNGETVIDNVHLDGITGGAIDPYESMPGPVMLQGDHGKIWFRNVLVTPALNE